MSTWRKKKNQKKSLDIPLPERAARRTTDRPVGWFENIDFVFPNAPSFRGQERYNPPRGDEVFVRSIGTRLIYTIN